VNSSAIVGWIPTTSSNYSFVIPTCMAQANPYVTSPAFGHKMWKPIIFIF